MTQPHSEELAARGDIKRARVNNGAIPLTDSVLVAAPGAGKALEIVEVLALANVGDATFVFESGGTTDKFRAFAPAVGQVQTGRIVDGLFETNDNESLTVTVTGTIGFVTVTVWYREIEV